MGKRKRRRSSRCCKNLAGTKAKLASGASTAMHDRKRGVNLPSVHAQVATPGLVSVLARWDAIFAFGTCKKTRPATKKNKQEGKRADDLVSPMLYIELTCMSIFF